MRRGLMLAVVLAVCGAGAVGVAGAQAPPGVTPLAPSGPPARYFGSIFVGAAPAAVGSVLEAWVLNVVETRCGSTVIAQPGAFTIDVASGGACGRERTLVIFRLDGRRAVPDAFYQPGGFIALNLLVTGEPPPPPPPPVPFNFALSVFEGEFRGFVYLVWDDISQLETRFELERWVPAGADFRVTVFTLPANSTETFDRPGAGAGVVYYRIRACRDLLCSAWTGFISAVVP